MKLQDGPHSDTVGNGISFDSEVTNARAGACRPIWYILFQRTCYANHSYTTVLPARLH